MHLYLCVRESKINTFSFAAKIQFELLQRWIWGVWLWAVTRACCMIACIWASWADTAGPFCPESPPALNLNCGGKHTETGQWWDQSSNTLSDTGGGRKNKNITIESRETFGTTNRPWHLLEQIKYPRYKYSYLLQTNNIVSIFLKLCNRCWTEASVSRCQNQLDSCRPCNFQIYWHLVVEGRNCTTGEYPGLWWDPGLFSSGLGYINTVQDFSTSDTRRLKTNVCCSSPTTQLISPQHRNFTAFQSASSSVHISAEFD